MPRISSFQRLQRLDQLSASNDEERKAALAAMAPALRNKLSQITRSIGERLQQTVMFYYQLGTHGVDIQENPAKYLTDEQKAANENPMILLEQVLDSTLVANLRRAIAFAECYTEEEVKRALALRCELPGREQFQLQWAHFVHLCSVHDKKVRQEIEMRTAMEGLSPKDMHLLIKAAHDGPRRSGGRKLAIPRTLKGQVSQIRDVCATVVQRHEQVWAGQRNNVFDNLLKVSADEYTDELIDAVENLHKTLIATGRAVTHEAHLAEKVLVRMKKLTSENGHVEPTQPNRPGVKSKGAKAGIGRVKKAAASK